MGSYLKPQLEIPNHFSGKNIGRGITADQRLNASNERKRGRGKVRHLERKRTIALRRVMLVTDKTMVPPAQDKLRDGATQLNLIALAFPLVLIHTTSWYGFWFDDHNHGKVVHKLFV